MKRLKNILACVMVVMTASLVLVGCGKKDADPDDYLAGVYYEEVADNVTLNLTGKFTIGGELSKTDMTMKLKKNGDDYKYLQTVKVYVEDEEVDSSTGYEEAINKGLFYEVRAYETDETEIEDHGKVYRANTYTKFELEDKIRSEYLYETMIIESLYNETYEIGGFADATVKDKKVDGSEKKFTYTAKLVSDEIDKGTLTLKVEKKRIVSYNVDVTFKKQAGQEKADYYKEIAEFSYKNVDINFDTKGYVEELSNTETYMEERYLPNENFTMTVATDEANSTVTTLQYSVSNNGTVKILVSEKQGTAEPVVKLYVEYVKGEQGTYTEKVYADGKEPATTEEVNEENLVDAILNTLTEAHYFTPAYCYVNPQACLGELQNYSSGVKQEGTKNTFTLNGEAEDATYKLVITVENGKITVGTLTRTVGEATTTGTYTYTYGTAEVNYTPTAAD